MQDITVKKTLKANLPKTDTDFSIHFTENGEAYVTKANGELINVSKQFADADAVSVDKTNFIEFFKNMEGETLQDLLILLDKFKEFKSGEYYIGEKNSNASWKVVKNGTKLQYWRHELGEYKFITESGNSVGTDNFYFMNPSGRLYFLKKDGGMRTLVTPSSDLNGVMVGNTRGRVSFLSNGDITTFCPIGEDVAKDITKITEEDGFANADFFTDLGIYHTTQDNSQLKSSVFYVQEMPPNTRCRIFINDGETGDEAGESCNYSDFIIGHGKEVNIGMNEISLLEPLPTLANKKIFMGIQFGVTIGEGDDAVFKPVKVKLQGMVKEINENPRTFMPRGHFIASPLKMENMSTQEWVDNDVHIGYKMTGDHPQIAYSGSSGTNEKQVNMIMNSSNSETIVGHFEYNTFINAPIEGLIARTGKSFKDIIVQPIDTTIVKGNGYDLYFKNEVADNIIIESIRLVFNKSLKVCINAFGDEGKTIDATKGYCDIYINNMVDIPRGETTNIYVSSADNSSDFLMGDGKIPYFQINYWVVENNEIITSGNLEEFAKQLPYSPRLIMDSRDLLKGESGILYQTEPKTYIGKNTFDDVNSFPRYNIQRYINRISFIYSPKTDGAISTLVSYDDTKDGQVSTMRFEDSENGGKYVQFDVVGIRKLDGTSDTISVRTDLTGVAPEGFVYAEKPYITEDDAEAESKKTWLFYLILSSNVATLTIRDPNGGTWKTIIKEVEYLSENTSCYVGSDKKLEGTNLARLVDIRINSSEFPNDTGERINIDERPTGIAWAKLITNIKRQVIDVGGGASTNEFDEIKMHDTPNPEVGERPIPARIMYSSQEFGCMKVIEFDSGKGMGVGIGNFMSDINLTANKGQNIKLNYLGEEEEMVIGDKMSETPIIGNRWTSKFRIKEFKYIVGFVFQSSQNAKIHIKVKSLNDENIIVIDKDFTFMNSAEEPSPSYAITTPSVDNKTPIYMGDYEIEITLFEGNLYGINFPACGMALAEVKEDSILSRSIFESQGVVVASKSCFIINKDKPSEIQAFDDTVDTMYAVDVVVPASSSYGLITSIGDDAFQEHSIFGKRVHIKADLLEIGEYNFRNSIGEQICDIYVNTDLKQTWETLIRSGFVVKPENIPTPEQTDVVLSVDENKMPTWIPNKLKDEAVYLNDTMRIIATPDKKFSFQKKYGDAWTEVGNIS